MKNKKILMFAIILILSVGFAAVSTTLYINSIVGIEANTNDYDIYYSNAIVNGVENKTVIKDDKHIKFTEEFRSIGDEYILQYYITNGSKNYDADVSINCTDGNDYVTVDNNWINPTLIESTDTKSGVLTLRMVKGYAGNDILELNVDCEITANAKEREEQGTTPPAAKVEQGINLYNLIKSNAKNDIINFSENSATSGTNGIYITTATEENVPVYYYRGSKEQVNNNIIFNNMCWKIIRTTETGGVKLIYNGVPTNEGKCTATGASTQIGLSNYNASRDDNAYLGYMYGTVKSNTYELTHANVNNSTVKTYIDTWYNENFDSIKTAMLEDTIFCNDRSTKAYNSENIDWTYGESYGTLGYGSNATLYSAFHRAYVYSRNPNPSLVCINSNDKFTVESINGNGKLTYPVGLITLDEIILAGYNTYASNKNDYNNQTNYLFTGENYWTMTPVLKSNSLYENDASVGSLFFSGQIGGGLLDLSDGVRPVISLKTNTLIENTGTGTSDSPYIVKE